MSTPTLILARSTNCADAPETEPLVRAIIGAWPSRPLPDVESTSPETILRTVDATPVTRRQPRERVAMILLGVGDPPSLVHQLIDRFAADLIPAVLLFPRVDTEQRLLADNAVLVETWHADPAYLAHTLRALACRQPAVETLARDLELATRFQGGMRGEMDRLHEELNLAALVQQELLPKQLPEVDGLQFGVLFRPATYVSGDIYGLSRLDDRRVAFFIADAVGHGVPAALISTVIVRSLPIGSGIDPENARPADAMTALNRELVRIRLEAPRFATAVYGVIDAAARQATLAIAGHPPPLLVAPGRVRRIEDGGPLLGVFDDEKYEQVTITLGHDETLLLYSDGFETAFPDADAGPEHRRRGGDRYLGQLAALPWPDGSGRTLEAPFAELASKIDEEAGSLHQVDDVTALAIAPKEQALRAAA